MLKPLHINGGKVYSTIKRKETTRMDFSASIVIKRIKISGKSEYVFKAK
jgi:hypothetical protein